MTDGIDISVAVATPSGLITPIVTGTAPVTLPSSASFIGGSPCLPVLRTDTVLI